ncbi:uncharacterized protein G2W53_032509 [Senna tora]|uniref:Uncharacterized protein n=1 Tax=Senna tora TaxID=362788 RepID=A0A834W7R3_9FABA|nr:uncharacterized protein G2W53_032509 [Senna tora]
MEEASCLRPPFEDNTTSFPRNIALLV